MPVDKISFEFISSGDTASYRVVRYGHPDHGRRVEIRNKAYPLYHRDGRRRYNYTVGEYMRQVVAVCGFLHWEHRAWEPLPEEYAHAFVAYGKANYESGKERAKRDKWYDPEFWPEYKPTLLGTAYYVFNENDRNKSHWIRTRIAF